jgi:hypothetical protein
MKRQFGTEFGGTLSHANDSPVSSRHCRCQNMFRDTTAIVGNAHAQRLCLVGHMDIDVLGIGVHECIAYGLAHDVQDFIAGNG